MDDMEGRGGFEVPSGEMMDLPCPKCTVVTQAHNFGFGSILVRCEACGHEYSMVRASGGALVLALGLDAWWDEPAYKAAQGSFSERGTFILAKLQQYDPAKLKDVLADVYRDAISDPTDITKFEWETILSYMGASPEQIKHVQKRMGRVWR
jgi:ribosomal protein S27E